MIRFSPSDYLICMFCLLSFCRIHQKILLLLCVAIYSAISVYQNTSQGMRTRALYAENSLRMMLFSPSLLFEAVPLMILVVVLPHMLKVLTKQLFRMASSARQKSKLSWIFCSRFLTKAEVQTQLRTVECLLPRCHMTWMTMM